MRYPSGRYIVTYEGTPPSYNHGDGRLVTRTEGRDVIDVTPSSGGLYIETTAPVEIHSVVREQDMPLHDKGELFEPLTLEKLKSLNVRCLRAVGLMKINGKPGNSQVHWNERPLPTNAFWGSMKGVPLEIIIDLCNRLAVDLHLNVPHSWLYSTMTEAAKLIKQRLLPYLNVYVELSNEIWNNDPSYRAQRDFMWAQGQRLWPDSTLPIHEKGWQYHGLKTAKMGGYFKAVLGKCRVTTVLCSQSSNAYLMRQMLTTPLWGKPAAQYIDALGIAPYIELRASSQNAETFFASELPGAVTASMKGVKAHRALADEFGKQLTAYEGGTSFLTDDIPTRAFFEQVSRDPRMTPALVDYLAQWKANGGGLFNWLGSIKAPGRDGDWGAWYSYCETFDPPKAQAVRQSPVPMGINAGNPTFYDSESLFVNKVRCTDGWVSQGPPGSSWGSGPPLTLDTDGHLIAAPTYTAGLLMQREFPAVNLFKDGM